jgi:hypothetical protein
MENVMPDEEVKPQPETGTTPPVVEPPVTEPPVVEEPFDKDRAMATIEKLRGIEKQYKQDHKELERLQAEEKKRADTQLSETEKLTKQAAELSAKNARLDSDILRRDVIAEVGLPASFASRLQGTTKEELLADAQELAKTLPQLKVAPKIKVTNPENSNQETEQQLHERISGRRSVDIFNVDHIKQHGGGVMDWTTKKE